jgi:hypothetical protein
MVMQQSRILIAVRRVVFMTIAACYLSAEGVVLGADSTTTMTVRRPGPTPIGTPHHFNFAQKVFEIGQNSTLAITMWGLGNLADSSYRTLIARFADDLTSHSPQTMQEVADRWNSFFWSAYSTEFTLVLQRVQQLQGQPTRTPDEEQELLALQQMFSGGFCLGGHLLHDRTPQAFEITYGPNLTVAAPVQALRVGTPRFWGVPNLIERLLYGMDGGIAEAILRSGKWTGTPDELFALAQPFFLGQPLHLPIREAIDWIHSSIHTTIKALKFSHLPPVCGGAVEVGVITTDRPFRWVRHKRLDSALTQGGVDGL